MKKLKRELIKYLLDCAERSEEYPVSTLNRFARKINLRLGKCDDFTYEIKEKEDVLFYGTFRDVLEYLVLRILDV